MKQGKDVVHRERDAIEQQRRGRGRSKAVQGVAELPAIHRRDVMRAEPMSRARHGRTVVRVGNRAVAHLGVPLEPLEHFAPAPYEGTDRRVGDDGVRQVSEIGVRVLRIVLRACGGGQMTAGNPDEPSGRRRRAAPLPILFDDEHAAARLRQRPARRSFRPRRIRRRARPFRTRASIPPCGALSHVF